MLTSHETLIFGFVISAGLPCTCARAQHAPEKTAAQKSTGKHYVLPANILPANKDTAQWGWYDPAEKPKLVVNSGDTVSIETWLHGMDEIKPGVTVDEIVKLRLANDGGGAAFYYRPYLCERRRARRHHGNSYYENCHEGLGVQFQSPWQTISHRRSVGL